MKPTLESPKFKRPLGNEQSRHYLLGLQAGKQGLRPSTGLCSVYQQQSSCGSEAAVCYVNGVMDGLAQRRFKC